MCILQWVTSLLCSCKLQQSKGRTATRTHMEHGHLDCKHFDTQTHVTHWPFMLTLTLGFSKSSVVHTYFGCSLTLEVPKHTLHTRRVNYITGPFLPPNQKWAFSFIFLVPQSILYIHVRLTFKFSCLVMCAQSRSNRHFKGHFDYELWRGAELRQEPWKQSQSFNKRSSS